MLSGSCFVCPKVNLTPCRNFINDPFIPSKHTSHVVLPHLWFVGNGRMVVIVVIIVPLSSIPY